MALFRRRHEIDYDKLAETIAEKALSPAIAQAGSAGSGVVRATPGGATYPVPSPSSPFSQTGGGIMEVPLPRPDASFNSLFGPGYPLTPDPLDPVGPNGRVAPRRSEYLVAWNLQLVDQQVPWTMLRWLAEDCDVVNRCIQLTQDEQCGLDWGWTFSDQLLHQIMVETGETNTAKATQIAREKYGSDLLRVQQFFRSPDQGMNQSFVDWLQALLWDHLVYDGVAIYPRYNLDGTLRHLELVDASTIKIYRDNRGRVPEPPAPAYAQILYGFPRGEFQHTPGEADDEYSADQLAYFIRRPRNTTVYGYPQVEEVMALATTYLGRQAWMRAEYTHGVTPKMLVETAETESWTPEQLAWFEQAFNDRLMGQIERRQTAFLLRPGMKALWAPQIEEHYKENYDNWLISQIASRFGRPPTMLGVQAKAGLSGGKQMEGEMNQSDIYSGKALTQWLIGLLNTLAVRYLDAPPGIITARASGGTEEDVEKQTAAQVSLVNAGVISRNELRAKRGEPLRPEKEADQLAISTGEGVTFLAGLLDAQENAQQLQAQQLTAGNKPSEPPTPDHAPPAPVKPATGGGHNDTSDVAPAQKAATPRAAGLVVKADDTGRVLMVQRAVDNHNEAAAGLWEWPGGRLKDGEAAIDAAKREWAQETGCELPDGTLAGSWTTEDGSYEAFVWVVKHEFPLDGDGDKEVENCAWFDPSKLAGNALVRVEVQSSDWALIGSAKKGAGSPKALAARKAVEAKIATHYHPAIVDGYRKLFPGVVKAARDAAAAHRNLGATKAAADDQAAMVAAAVTKFRQSLKANTAPLAAVLTALRTDAWIAGLRSAAQGPGGDSISANLGPLSVDEPEDWEPGWAASADISSPPAGLAEMLNSTDADATRLSGGLLDRICSALEAGLLAGTAVSGIGSDVRSVVGDETWPETATITETADATETATQAAYQAGGYTGFNVIPDASACNLCMSMVGEYEIGSRRPPWHPRCGCGSEPVTDEG